MQPFIVSVSQPRKVIISINIGEILTNYFKITNNPNIATWNIPNSTIIFYIAWFFINFIRNFIRAIEKSLVIQQFVCQTKVGFIYVLNTGTPPLTRFFRTQENRVLGGWLKDISNLDFSTPNFNPRPFNTGLFNHELSIPGIFNPRLWVGKSGVEKFMVEKSGVEMSRVGKSRVEIFSWV